MMSTRRYKQNIMLEYYSTVWMTWSKALFLFWLNAFQIISTIGEYLKWLQTETLAWYLSFHWWLNKTFCLRNKIKWTDIGAKISPKSIGRTRSYASPVLIDHGRPLWLIRRWSTWALTTCCWTRLAYRTALCLWLCLCLYWVEIRHCFQLDCCSYR